MQQDGHARIGVDHGDAGAHRARADDGRAADLGGRGALGHIRQLRHLAFGKEQMHERSRLGGHDALGEDLDLAIRALVERQHRGRLDRVDGLVRRPGTAGDLVDAAPRQRARIHGRSPIGHLRGHLARRARTRRHRLIERELHGAGDEVAVDNPIDEAVSEGAAGRDRLSGRAHLEGSGDAHETGQTLGAPAAGDDPELCLRQSQARVRRTDAVMTGECHFEAAAERTAMDRSDDRRASILELNQGRVKGAAHGDRRVR